MLLIGVPSKISVRPQQFEEFHSISAKEDPESGSNIKAVERVTITHTVNEIVSEVTSSESLCPFH